MTAGAGYVGGPSIILLWIVGVVAWRRQRRHADDLRSWAAANGWTVTGPPDADWGARLPGGSRFTGTVALSGVVHGRPICVAEYTVSRFHPAGTAVVRSTQYYTVVGALLTEPMWDTAVENRTPLSRLGRALGRGAEYATGHPDFDRYFRVRTTDPHAIGTWCHPALMEAHLHGHVPPWRVDGVQLLTYRTGRLDVGLLPRQVERVVHLAALLVPGIPE